LILSSVARHLAYSGEQDPLLEVSFCSMNTGDPFGTLTVVLADESDITEDNFPDSPPPTLT
jgi:hypothetical protein